jgi:hypothetical protein
MASDSSRPNRTGSWWPPTCTGPCWNSVLCTLEGSPLPNTRAGFRRSTLCRRLGSVGFRFGKSFRIPGGFRLNVSKRGLGASWGLKGFRIGAGPRGTRVSAYIPGTGLGWTSSFGGGRSAPSSWHLPRGSGSTIERAARVRQRQLEAQAREFARFEERQRAAHEVAWFENHLALLESLHKEASSPWDWLAIASSAAPIEPTLQRANEMIAAQALANWRPTFTDSVMGRKDAIRRDLQENVETARAQDWATYQAAIAHHHQELARWNWFVQLAKGITEGDIAAYDAALEYLSPFAELHQLGGAIEATAVAPLVAEARIRVHGEQVVPSELLSLTKTGKVSKKKMPTARFWELYQDHVCSAIFRVGRELFSLLPIEVALVHGRGLVLDSATGKHEEQTLVSVALTRSEFSALAFEHIDPSDALEKFPHAMEFSKRGGLEPVDEIALDAVLEAAGLALPA